MPNLVGIWRREANAAAIGAGHQRQIAAVQSGPRVCKTHRLTGSNWAAALLDHGLLENGPQPGKTSDGSVAVLLDGEILNLDELSKQHRLDAAVRPVSRAALCAALIAQRGLGIVREFNGLFALVVAHDEGRRLSLVSDRYSARPLFYREEANGLSFATELKGVLAGATQQGEVDATAICELLVYGVHFGGRTWLKGCERMPPATILTLDAAGVHTERYWSYLYCYDNEPLDNDSYATRFAVLLDRAVERCMRGSRRIGMFLSAGYDSRAVAASIRQYHLPLPTFTFGVANSRDVLLAPQVAEKLGLDHYHLTSSGAYLAPNAAAIVWRTEGMLPFTGTTSIRFHDQIGAHADIILTGFLAEFCGSHTWPQLLLTRSRPAAIEAIFQRFVTARLARAQTVLRPEVFARAYEELRHRFEKSFVDNDNEHPFDVADSWNFTQLQPNGTCHAPAVDRHRFEMRAPLMDAELVDFLLTIRPWTRLEQRIYKLMIARSFAAIRDVPCANSMRPIEPRFWVEYPQMTARLIGRKVAAPVRRLLGREDRLGREINDLDADIRAEPQLRSGLLDPILAGAHLDPAIFDVGAVQRLVQAEFDQHRDHGALLGSLASLGLAHRQIIGGDVADVPAYLREPCG